MSKNRLRDIKILNITEAIKCIDLNYNGEYTNVNINEIVKDVDWLIEQAERVQELEDVLDQDARQDVLVGLYEENKRYRDIIQDFIDHADDYNISRVEKYHLRKALESEE